MIRCATYTLAAALPLWGLAASFYTDWYWLLIVAGATIWMLAELADRLTQ